jgi:hypothetical protein
VKTAQAWNAIVTACRNSPAGRFVAGRMRRRQSVEAPAAVPGGAARLIVPHLEIHITHKCNLTCDGCLYFTNHRHSGTIPFEDLQQSLTRWSRRLVPRSFAILGGEPCMHRDLSRIVYLTRELWSAAETKVEVVTNGLLLHVHPELPRALSETDTSLYISVHSTGAISPRYEEKISKAIDLARRWEKDFGIRLEVAAQTEWYRGYKGFGAAMAPFEDGDPGKSWDNCVTGQQCFQLFEDRVWKCAPLAYLRLQDRAYTLSEKWRPYLAYQPLDPDCTRAELAAFFNRKAESFCGMCPSNPQVFTKPDPLLRVEFYRTSPEAAAPPVVSPV